MNLLKPLHSYIPKASTNASFTTGLEAATLCDVMSKSLPDLPLQLTSIHQDQSLQDFLLFSQFVYQHFHSFQRNTTFLNLEGK